MRVCAKGGMMKDRILIMIMVLVFILVVFTYARYNTFQQDMLRGGIESVGSTMNQVLGLLQRYDRAVLESQDKMSALERRLLQSEFERQQLVTRIEALTTDMSQLRQAAIAAAAAAAQKKEDVELGKV